MRLQTFLMEREISVAQFADRMNRTPMSVYRWISGERLPRHGDLERIKQLTGGLVTANDFHHPPTEAAQ